MSGSEQDVPLESELLRQSIRLYLYGELGLAERREIERCREEDPAFRVLFEDEQAFLLALGDTEAGHDLEPLLRECRCELDLAIGREPAPGRNSSLTSRLRAALRGLNLVPPAQRLAWQAAVACVLLVSGFIAGRETSISPLPRADSGQSPWPGQLIASSDRMLTGIETVRLDPVGDQVQIVLEERTTISGNSSDPDIRRILLDTVQQAHAGARLTSLDALREHASEGEVRTALVRSMLDDDELGVRLKALEALQGHAGHPEVRRALLQTLLEDPSSGMRVHAIQLLRDHAARDMAGPLQELIETESDPFVIQESERILDSLGASMERF